MEVIIKISQFIAIISLLVILHELGHFIPAKLFKTRVEKFYLFFDPWFSIIKKKIGGTVYGIGWLPFGGYVKISGMIDESMDTEQMKQPPKPWEFRSKPAWQRLIIMLGGVIVNVLLSWVIYSTMLVTQGDTYIPTSNLKNGILVDERGEKLGFLSGDKIISVDNKPLERYGDIMLEVILGDEVLIERNGKKQTIKITDEGLKQVFTGLKNPFFSPTPGTTIGEIQDKSLAMKNGILSGDKVTAVNNKPIALWSDFVNIIKSSQGGDLVLDIDRNGKMLHKTISLKKGEILGVLPTLSDLKVTDQYTFLEAIPAGFKKTFTVLSRQVRQFKVIFKPKTEAYKQVKGPIGIIEQMPSSWDWTFFWSFSAMFSVWLAFVNILPIPALDGGHVMFLLYEIIAGKAPSEKVMEKGQIIGFVIVMGLMVLVIGQDIFNLVKNLFN